MNTEIARGKRIDNGKWILGGLRESYSPLKFEYTIGSTPVEQKTICHFTRKIDKNGKKIFSDDIVRYKGDNYRIIMDKDNNFLMNGIGFEFYCGIKVEVVEMEVVGNVYDDPELQWK